jgi:hypothetical protein
MKNSKVVANIGCPIAYKVIENKLDFILIGSK